MTDTIEETMFCRLCLVSTEHYQSLDDGIIDIVEELLKTTVNTFNSKNGHELALEGIRNSIICSNCVTKIKNACEFKLTCEDTKVILSHYVGSQENSKLDLKMIYLVEKEPGKEVHSYEEMKICRTCLNMIETGHYACLLDAIKKNNLEHIFQLYLPELMSTLTESPPLICGKCINNFRCFSEFISTFMNTENKIKRFREEIDLGRQNDLDQEITGDSFEEVDEGADEIITENGESKIMKLFEDEHLLLDCYSNNTLLVEDHEKIMKMLIKEDIDLFYKETPDFDSEGDEIEESECDSYQGNIDKKSHNSRKNSHQTEYKIFGIDEIQNSTSSLSPIPAEEPSSPEIMSPEKWFNNKRSRPKINKTKNRLKSKKKKLLKTTTNTAKPSKPWPNRKPGKYRNKCRKVYGVEQKDMWCTQCRWKKACTKFATCGVEPR